MAGDLKGRAVALREKVAAITGNPAIAFMLPSEVRAALGELAGLVEDMAGAVEQLEGVCFGE